MPRDAPQQRDDSFLRKDFAYLFQRLHCHVCDVGGDEQGIMLFDEMDRALSERLLAQITKYFVETERGRDRAARLIPTPFFVHSHLTPAIQLADLVAYIVNWGLRMPRMEMPMREELKPLADQVFELRYRGRERLFRRAVRGKQIWGISYISDLRPRVEQQDEDPDLDRAA